ncbi:putative acetyltransferase [Desulfosporosinus acidiphilus SJ4]|uniref:Putative acetyltransferase n=2 Tax=Desulfosporosinus TaxID=79206 RepID=I4D7L0_DESAJ|nr:putative acetyltransferase [Desulfosporosinus acidiphilus SJ4]
MQELRLALKGEELRLKELWKLCFGDPESYINFFYTNRYKADETAVLLEEGTILAMLTMIPVRTITVEKRNFRTAMLYAIATDPKHQNKGLATKLIDYCDIYLKTCKTQLSVLVPASLQLFNFYRKLGFQNGFYIKEAQFFRSNMDRMPIQTRDECTISAITPQEYNRRRNNQLKGKVYISYSDEDIAYQKKLSQLSGADIYGVDVGDSQGCFAVERLSSDKVLIKEILLPENCMTAALKAISTEIEADDYSLRTHPHLGAQLEGTVRPFGMVRMAGEIEGTITSNNFGYLGLAFD